MFIAFSFTFSWLTAAHNTAPNAGRHGLGTGGAYSACWQQRGRCAGQAPRQRDPPPHLPPPLALASLSILRCRAIAALAPFPPARVGWGVHLAHPSSLRHLPCPKHQRLLTRPVPCRCTTGCSALPAPQKRRAPRPSAQRTTGPNPTCGSCAPPGRLTGLPLSAATHRPWLPAGSSLSETITTVAPADAGEAAAPAAVPWPGRLFADLRTWPSFPPLEVAPEGGRMLPGTARSDTLRRPLGAPVVQSEAPPMNPLLLGGSPAATGLQRQAWVFPGRCRSSARLQQRAARRGVAAAAPSAVTGDQQQQAAGPLAHGLALRQGPRSEMEDVVTAREAPYGFLYAGALWGGGVAAGLAQRGRRQPGAQRGVGREWRAVARVARGCADGGQWRRGQPWLQAHGSRVHSRARAVWTPGSCGRQWWWQGDATAQRSQLDGLQGTKQHSQAPAPMQRCMTATTATPRPSGW